MGSETEALRTSSSPAQNTAAAEGVVGASSRASELRAPQHPMDSVLAGGIPLPAGAGEEARHARDLLLAVGRDPAKRLEVIKRILEVAATAPVAVAFQLLEVVKAFATDPTIAHALAEAQVRLAQSRPAAAKSATLSTAAIADAQKYNSAHPQNVATFSSRVGDAVMVGGVVDVERVARWQQGKGVEADGKIGPATLEASAHELSAKTNPVVAASSSTHGTSTQTTSTTSAEYDAATTAAHEKQERDFDAADVGDSFFRPRKMVDVQPVEVFDAITRKAPGVSHDFRVLMTGQATGEQGHRANHYNFMGYEFGSTRPPFGKPPANTVWTRDFRSDRISVGEYHANPTYYYNWHSYGQTIAHQLAVGATLLYVLWYAPRPVYASVDEAAGKFVSGIVSWRLEAFKKSKHQHHRDVAAKAEAGDIEAYLEVVETVDTELGVLAYNGTNLYKPLMRPILAKAKGDAAFSHRP